MEKKLTALNLAFIFHPPAPPPSPRLTSVVKIGDFTLIPNGGRTSFKTPHIKIAALDSLEVSIGGASLKVGICHSPNIPVCYNAGGRGLNILSMLDINDKKMVWETLMGRKYNWMCGEDLAYCNYVSIGDMRVIFIPRLDELQDLQTNLYCPFWRKVSSAHQLGGRCIAYCYHADLRFAYISRDHIISLVVAVGGRCFAIDSTGVDELM